MASKMKAEYLMNKVKFVEGILMGMNDKQAAQHAGLSGAKHQLKRLRDDPWVNEQIQNIAQSHIHNGAVTKQKVEGIVLEAIDIARIKAEPGDMIRGASELSKMNGYYAPEKKEISLDGEVAIRQIETMSDAELLQMLGQEQPAIEVEFERIEGGESAK